MKVGKFTKGKWKTKTASKNVKAENYQGKLQHEKSVDDLLVCDIHAAIPAILT